MSRRPGVALLALPMPQPHLLGRTPPLRPFEVDVLPMDQEQLTRTLDSIGANRRAAQYDFVHDSKSAGRGC